MKNPIKAFKNFLSSKTSQDKLYDTEVNNDNELDDGYIDSVEEYGCTTSWMCKTTFQ